MSQFSRVLLLSLLLNSHLYAESDLSGDGEEVVMATSDMTNFAFGLGYGLLDEKSLMNIDFKVNIPINDYLSTQLLLNSNYLITGSSKNSFAQSEFSSNWFLSNEYGRLGLGLGVTEMEPMDEAQDTERDVIGQFLGELFVGPVSVTTNYISSDTTLSNVTSSRIGISYYFNEDLRTSLFREKYNVDEIGWRLETYFQPKKYLQMGSVGIIARTGKDYDYLGVVALYYFDYAVSLKQREREFH
ncbi:hypothetical protein KDW99_06835 [Marinomonas rhizomae]|uniref:hypothetical protein n=1 Tax=Marinomonas rhizomae TaxID=491948 RepID=UPI002104AA64|nr:hypothetical protein [Marinomonas rhizomae]UTW00834.1 hypothetical protein KDW99_06835 [Marinomonas rhizomae]